MADADREAASEAAQGPKCQAAAADPSLDKETLSHSAIDLKPGRKRKLSIRCAANGCFDPAQLPGIRGRYLDLSLQSRRPGQADQEEPIEEICRARPPIADPRLILVR